MKNWFDVDKDGLAKLTEARGKGALLFELLQNAWDQTVTRVDLDVTPIADQPKALVTVTDDDPDGFADLTHAFTLFAESGKKGDPAKRGRFNLGEKLVLACCENATVVSTRGGVSFGPGGRTTLRTRRSVGTRFSGVMRMTRAELAEAVADVRRAIPPALTHVNGIVLPRRDPVATWEAALQTEVAGEDGVLRRVVRTTAVSAYEPLPGETGTLYELGIPVVETGDRWHVSVGQKVPLTLDRSNVPPAFLRAVRVGLLNALGDRLASEDEATRAWVRDAAGHPDADPAAVGHVLDLRFGERRVAYDPSDPEANKIAVSEGYTVVPGGALSGDEWAKAREAGLQPAGHVTPSPKPFGPDGTPLRMLEAPTAYSEAFTRWAAHLGQRLLGIQVRVRLANDPGWGFGGCFGGGELTVNVARFGGRAGFFSDGPTERLLAFLIHEFAHHYERDHLARGFYDACCDLGARLARLAAEEPALVDVAVAADAR